MRSMITATALCAVSAAANAGVLGVELDPGNEASVNAPLFMAEFGVSGTVGIDVDTDSEGKLSNATLCAADLLIGSAGVYAFAGAGSLTLSNIGISLAQKGGQEYFFNETAGSSQPGDYAGFLDIGGIAALTGTFAIDIDGDGEDEFSRDFSMLDEEFRVFDFEGLITRAGGSSVYELTTSFALVIDTDINGQSLPITIEFTGGGLGVIPAPASFGTLALAGVLASRRRR